MRTLLILLLTVSCFGQGLTLRSPLRDIAAGAAAAPPSNITVDYWEDFEFGSDGNNPTELQLEATHAPYTNDWTLTGTTTLGYVRTVAQKAFTSTINTLTDTGSRGLEVDINGANTANRGWFLKVNNGSALTSFGFWIKGSSLVASVNPVHPIIYCTDVVGAIQTRILTGTDGSANLYLNLEGSGGAGSNITLTPDVWYRVEMTSQRNAAALLTVYNTSNVSVGTSSGTGFDKDFYYFFIGNFNVWPEIGSIYIDNVVVSKSGTTPLGP